MCPPGDLYLAGTVAHTGAMDAPGPGPHHPGRPVTARGPPDGIVGAPVWPRRSWNRRRPKYQGFRCPSCPREQGKPRPNDPPSPTKWSKAEPRGSGLAVVPAQEEHDEHSDPYDRRTGQSRVQGWFLHRHRDRHGAARSERGHHPHDLRPQERAGLHAPVASQGLPSLVDHDRAVLGPRPVSPRGLPGYDLLRRSENFEEGDQPG